MSKNIQFIDEVSIENKKVLLRVDFNVAFKSKAVISDDTKIRQALPTIKLLCKNRNKVIIVSHLNNPKNRDPRYSLKTVFKRVKKLLPQFSLIFVENFQSAEGKKTISSQKSNEIIVLENIRYYEGEKSNDMKFAKELSKIADIYVNDAFGVSHRAEASLVKVPTLIPSFGGLLLKTETKTISEALRHGKNPFVAIIGGAKMDTKIGLLAKLIGRVDYILVGGGIANTFLMASGHEIGKSEYGTMLKEVKELLVMAQIKGTRIVLPTDVVTGKSKDQKKGTVKNISDLSDKLQILDIGPKTQANYKNIIMKAKTIVWNGPVGYFENKAFAAGTKSIYYAIVSNDSAVSIIGGGETLSSISNNDLHNKVTHISTGGGAMLDFIQHGTLPGIQALIHA